MVHQALIGSRGLCVFMLFVALCISNTSYAGLGEIHSYCVKLKLKEASGVPNDTVHKYKFVGSCELILETKSDGMINMKTIPVFAAAEWQLSTHTLHESYAVMGPVDFTYHYNDGDYGYNPVIHISTGKVSNIFKCTEDPVISSATCGLVAHDNKSNFQPFTDLATIKKLPLTKGITYLAEAAALSKQAANKPDTGKPPPPPPPNPQPTSSQPDEPKKKLQSLKLDAIKSAAPHKNKTSSGKSQDVPTQSRQGSSVTTRSSGSQQRAGLDQKEKPKVNYAAVKSAINAMLINVEGGDLVTNKKYLVSGGAVAARPVPGASGNAKQLFWGGGSVGAVLDLIINVPVAATYAVELYPTRAPDYGQVTVSVDGHDGPMRLENYSPHVMQSTPRQIGKFYIGKGERKISFMIVGKNASSSGYLFGIERIRLYPTGN